MWCGLYLILLNTVSSLLVGLLQVGRLDINHSGAHGVGSLRDAVCQMYWRNSTRSWKHYVAFATTTARQMSCNWASSIPRLRSKLCESRVLPEHMSQLQNAQDTMTVFCTVFEMKPDTGRKTQIFHTGLYLTCTIPQNLFDFLPKILIQTARVLSYQARQCKKVAEKFNLLTSVHHTSQTDRQTTCDRRQTDGSCHKPYVTQ